ncbi:MAG: ATP-binding protein [Xanthobacteraceae bacterium]
MNPAAKPLSHSAPADGEPRFEANLSAIDLGFRWLQSLLDKTPGPEAGIAREAYVDRRRRLIEQGEPTQIDRLSRLFGLSPFDEDLLLLALAPQLRSGFATLYGRANGRASATAATPHLAISLLGDVGIEAEARVWQRLSPTAPLRRFCLIDTPDGQAGPLSPILLDERMAQLLIGEDFIDSRLRAMLSAPEAAPLPDKHRRGVELLARQMSQAERSMVAIVGPKGCGRRAAARALASSLGVGLAAFRPRPFEPAEKLPQLLAREAALGGFALLVDADDAESRRLLDDGIDAPAIAIAGSRPDLPGHVPVLRLEPLSADEQVILWRQALGPRSAETDREIEAVAGQFRFGPSEIAAIAAAGGALWQACRDRAGVALDKMAERIVPRYDWDDLVLAPDLIQDLKAVAAQVRHRATVYGRHGFARKLHRGRGVSLLLSGPSGTGKTMAAEVIAHSLDLDLYRIDLSGVVSKYIGETEKNLKAVFDAADQSGAVLFFDEADALFGKRSEIKDSHDRYANIEISYLLQRMESYGGLSILATNMKGHLDSAFLRRLRFALDIPFPDAALRQQIWVRSFPDELPREALDFAGLARLEIAGGNISVIAINAAFLAATEGAPLAMRHIARAARAEFRKLDKEFRIPWTESI